MPSPSGMNSFVKSRCVATLELCQVDPRRRNKLQNVDYLAFDVGDLGYRPVLVSPHDMSTSNRRRKKLGPIIRVLVQTSNEVGRSVHVGTDNGADHSFASRGHN